MEYPSIACTIDFFLKKLNNLALLALINTTRKENRSMVGTSFQSVCDLKVENSTVNLDRNAVERISLCIMYVTINQSSPY